MVDAVLKDLPKEWNGVVVMDWSDGPNCPIPAVLSWAA